MNFYEQLYLCLASRSHIGKSYIQWVKPCCKITTNSIYFSVRTKSDQLTPDKALLKVKPNPPYTLKRPRGRGRERKGISIRKCNLGALYSKTFPREGGSRGGYISILLAYAPRCAGKANTIRAFSRFPPPFSTHTPPYGKLIRARPVGNPFCDGKYLRGKLKFDSGRSSEDGIPIDAIVGAWNEIQIELQIIVSVLCAQAASFPDKPCLDNAIVRPLMAAFAV